MENFTKLPRNLLCYLLMDVPILELQALSMTNTWFARFLEANPKVYHGKWLKHSVRMKKGNYPKQKWDIYIAKQYPQLYAAEQCKKQCKGSISPVLDIQDRLIAKYAITTNRSNRSNRLTQYYNTKWFSGYYYHVVD